jgi:DnaJ-like protein
MPALFFGLLILVLALWALHTYSKADPKKLAQLTLFLGLRGAIYEAIPLGMVGLGLLGWGPFAQSGLFQRTQKTPGQVSKVRSPFVEMELDHDSGTMRGTILAGGHAGTPLDALDVPALLALLTEFDPDSRALLAAYLDRREPGWRDQTQEHAGAGQGPRAARAGGPMSEEEALQILGVPAEASVKEIGRAHRALMKKLHPDQGGSNYLAAKINEAKEVLTRRARAR